MTKYYVVSVPDAGLPEGIEITMAVNCAGAVIDHPTSAWTAQQLRNAFPNEEFPADLLHDRDGAFAGIAGTLAAMQIQNKVTAPRLPWQNAYVERFIGLFDANASIT